MLVAAALHTAYDVLVDSYRQLSRVKLPSWSDLARHASEALRDGSRFF